MSAETIIFYLLGAVILVNALLAVTARRIFRAATFLLFSLIGVAGLYFYLRYEFLAAVQIVVYVGGVVVLIIFAIFLTAGSGDNMRTPSVARLLVSGVVTIGGGLLTSWLLSGHHFTAGGGAFAEPDTRNIGRQMLSTTEHGYILPFEVVSLLLLAAMIGCIVIAIKPKSESNE